ncbi:MAG: DUF4115 domain-containing protein, partial [Firmicutes bacterium]|nr:DUF4115 domain-containing protein [Bacillota bacterium]
YFKGALRKYATELGLDANELMNRYNNLQTPEQTEESTEATPPQKIDTPKKKRMVKSKVAIHGTGKNFSFTRLLSIFIIILLVAALLYTAIRLLSERQPPPVDPAPTTGEENNEVENEREVEPEVEEPEPLALTVTRDPNTEDVRFIVANADEITAELSFSNACWIKVIADGTEALSQTFRRNQGEEVTASEEMTIRPGNPPAFSLKINGQEVDLPETIHPYTLTITRNNE